MIRTTWHTANGDSVRVFEGADGQWRWHVRAGNGEVVGQGEAHPDVHDAVTAAERHHPPAD